MKKKNYDLEKVYDEQIFPLMQQIIEICTKHDMPFVADFQYAVKDDDHAHCSSAWMPGKRDIDPNLSRAFDAIKPRRRLPALNITVRDKDGNATEMITILD